jgi:hypothetical protein
LVILAGSDGIALVAECWRFGVEGFLTVRFEILIFSAIAPPIRDP